MLIIKKNRFHLFFFLIDIISYVASSNSQNYLHSRYIVSTVPYICSSYISYYRPLCSYFSYSSLVYSFYFSHVVYSFTSIFATMYAFSFYIIAISCFYPFFSLSTYYFSSFFIFFIFGFSTTTTFFTTTFFRVHQSSRTPTLQLDIYHRHIIHINPT